MSKPDCSKKFPKIVNIGDEVYVALRKFRGDKTGKKNIGNGIIVEFDKKGRIIGVTIKR